MRDPYRTSAKPEPDPIYRWRLEGEPYPAGIGIGPGPHGKVLGRFRWRWLALAYAWVYCCYYTAAACSLAGETKQEMTSQNERSKILRRCQDQLQQIASQPRTNSTGPK